MGIGKHLHIMGTDEHGWGYLSRSNLSAPGHRQGACRQHVDRTNEAHHKGAGGMVIDLRWGTDLFDASLVHHHDAISHLHRLFLVVGHDHGGDVHLVMELAQPGAQLLAHLGVEGTEGLIQQEHPRLHRQRPGQGHPLPLPAGELGGVAAAIAAQLHQIQQLVDATADRLLFPAAELQAERHVLAHVAVLEEGEVLKNKAHLPVLDGAIRGLLASDPDAAGVGLLQTGDQAKQRALSRAGGPEQGHQGA